MAANEPDRSPENQEPLEAQPSKPAKSSGTATKPAPQKTPPKLLPPWKVLLHNDEVNDIVYVVETVHMLTSLSKEESVVRTIEAHQRGVSLLLTTHQERAELYRDQFTSKKLTVTIEPAEE